MAIQESLTIQRLGERLEATKFALESLFAKKIGLVLILFIFTSTCDFLWLYLFPILIPHRINAFSHSSLPYYSS